MPFPVSPLIKQGLLATNGAQERDEPGQTEDMEVIKTGGVDSTSNKQRSMSPNSNATGRIRSTTMQRTVKSEDGRFGHSAGEEYEDDDRTSTSTSTNTSGPEGGSGAGRSGVVTPSGTRLGGVGACINLVWPSCLFPHQGDDRRVCSSLVRVWKALRNPPSLPPPSSPPLPPLLPLSVFVPVGSPHLGGGVAIVTV